MFAFGCCMVLDAVLLGLLASLPLFWVAGVGCFCLFGCVVD